MIVTNISNGENTLKKYSIYLILLFSCSEFVIAAQSSTDVTMADSTKTLNLRLDPSLIEEDSSLTRSSLNIVNLDVNKQCKNPFGKGTAITAVGVVLLATGVLNFLLAESFPEENRQLFFAEGGIRGGIGFFMIIGGIVKSTKHNNWELKHK